MSIQILQYEFLGPVPLDQWGPPMEKLVYLIMSRDGDKFNLVYAGDCERTDDRSFFVQHEQFKCWVQQSGSEKSLYLAILPLADSSPHYRGGIIQRILERYRPPCNSGDMPEKKPDYAVRRTKPEPEGFSCPCCGSEMRPEQLLEKSTVYRCASCGMSDTRLNS